MNLRRSMPCLLLALTAVFSSACSKPPEAPAAAAAPAASTPPAAPAATEPAAAPAASSTPVATPAETPAAAVSGGLQSSDYQDISGGKPYREVPGKIEVVEFFNYVCPACDAFNPLLQAWKAKLPADVNVVYVPADFRDDFMIYARAYYAADLLGLVGKSHEAVYKAIHTDHALPGEGGAIDPKVIAGFYSQYGVTAQQFLDAMESFAVNARMGQGHQFMVESRITSTPSLIINGRYLVKGQTFDDKLRIAGLLVERVRKQGHP